MEQLDRSARQPAYGECLAGESGRSDLYVAIAGTSVSVPHDAITIANQAHPADLLGVFHIVDGRLGVARLLKRFGDHAHTKRQSARPNAVRSSPQLPSDHLSAL